MQERRVSESRHLKTSQMEIASAVERMVLPVNPNFKKDQTNVAENLIIHDRLIPNPFSLKTVNNVNSSPPFGLFDLPLHSTTSMGSPLTSHLKIYIAYSVMVM